MDALTASRAKTAERKGDPALAARLSRETEGEVLFDAFSRHLRVNRVVPRGNRDHIER